MVNVVNGVNPLSAPLEGRTVAEIRGMLSQALNIAPDAQAMVAGAAADSGHVLTDGDELEFVKPSGTKG